MDDISRISGARVVVGGLIAGVIHYALTGVINGVILRQQLEGWIGSAGGVLHPRTPAVSMSLWAVMSLCYGLIGIWWYGGMRTRLGAGLSTALLVGVALWTVAKLTVALDLLALGIMPAGIIVSQTTGGFVAIVAGILAGARYADGSRLAKGPGR
jgi:hypothetical protein